MGLYLIGIGGTGSKIIEAVAHFCAAGLMPKDTLRTVFVDPDVSNGNLDRSTVTVRTYERCKNIQLGDSPLFNTKVQPSDGGPWSPLGKQAKPTLNDLFEYNLLRNQDEGAAALFDVLFSKQERETSLERGFRGHPSIGAAVLARSVRMESEEPWATLRDQIGEDASQSQPVRIFVAGSIFGGTGASGFPTIGRLLRNELEQIGSKNVGLSGMLMLPYFSFVPSKKVKENGELYASSDGFLVSAKAALKYYSQHRADDTFDTIYLVGDRALSPVETFSTGSSTQKNAPHFAELFAAAAAMDFFRNEGVRKEGSTLVATRSDERLGWGDIPEGSEVRSRLGSLARFAFAYVGVYYPAFERLKGGEASYGTPWYVDHVRRRGVDIHAPEVWDEIEALKTYSELFLRWITGVQGGPSGGGARKLFLFNPDTVATKSDVRPQLGSFGDMVLDVAANAATHEGAAKGLDDVWERVSRPSVRDPRASGIGHFAAELYRATAI